MSVASAGPKVKVQHKAKGKTTVKAKNKKVVRKASYSTSGAETSLVGIKLYDSNVRVLDLYGSPDSIEGVFATGGSGSGGNFGPGAGSPGAGFPGAGAPSAGFPGAPGGRGGDASADVNYPFNFGDDILKQTMPANQSTAGISPAAKRPGVGGGGAPSSGGYPGAGPSGAPGAGFPGGGPSGPGFPGGGPSGTPGVGGGAVAGERVTYTRWIYTRSGTKYGFIIDKSGHVVQIEAIGLSNPKVRTRRGAGFGSSFGDIIRKYGNPDGYELAGDNVMMRYLTKSKVAFRLSRLEAKKPQVVTGIVVAAGKQ